MDFQPAPGKAKPNNNKHTRKCYVFEWWDVYSSSEVWSEQWGVFGVP